MNEFQIGDIVQTPTSNSIYKIIALNPYSWMKEDHARLFNVKHDVNNRIVVLDDIKYAEPEFLL